MEIFIALFRGINVGGRNILPMKGLRHLLAQLGLDDVRTYIQSGNVLFRSADLDTDKLQLSITAAVDETYGFAPNVLILPANFLIDAAASNPFSVSEEDYRSMHFFFLSDEASEPDLGRLDELKSATERYVLQGRVFYLHAPDGIGRSKLASNVESVLGIPITGRNLRTVSKILTIAADMDVGQQGAGKV